MQIEVQYTTQLRMAIGHASESVELPEGSTLACLIETLATRHADAFARLVLDQQQRLLPNIILTIGDQQIRTPDQHALRDQDRVTFLSAISGG